MLHATSEHNGSAVIISASGEVDAANKGAWKQLLYEVAAITIAPGPVVIDIRNLDFMGCCAYAALAREALRCRRRGVSLCLVSHKPIVGRIVAICELRQMLPIYPTIETALSCATAGPSWPVNPVKSAIERWRMVDIGEFARKLRIEPGHRVAVVNAPPECALFVSRAGGLEPNRADVVIGFAIERADLASLNPVYAAALDARLAWVSCPRSGGLGTDLQRDWLARAVRRYGVQAVEHVAIDDSWSALLLRPAPDNEPDTFTADIAWPPTQ